MKSEFRTVMVYRGQRTSAILSLLFKAITLPESLPTNTLAPSVTTHVGVAADSLKRNSFLNYRYYDLKQSNLSVSPSKDITLIELLEPSEVGMNKLSSATALPQKPT